MGIVASNSGVHMVTAFLRPKISIAVIKVYKALLRYVRVKVNNFFTEESANLY